FYLEGYGIADRVMLAGVSDPVPPLAELSKHCADGCRGPTDPARFASFNLRGPFDQPSLMRRLMRMRESSMGSTISRVGLVAWAPAAPAAPHGIVGTRLDGLTLFEPAP